MLLEPVVFTTQAQPKVWIDARFGAGGQVSRRDSYRVPCEECDSSCTQQSQLRNPNGRRRREDDWQQGMHELAASKWPNNVPPFRFEPGSQEWSALELCRVLKELTLERTRHEVTVFDKLNKGSRAY